MHVMIGVAVLIGELEFEGHFFPDRDSVQPADDLALLGRNFEKWCVHSLDCGRITAFSHIIDPMPEIFPGEFDWRPI
jgi:hypothetical protein